MEIVSRAGWGTEVRMHMPIALKAAQENIDERERDSQDSCGHGR